MLAVTAPNHLAAYHTTQPAFACRATNPAELFAWQLAFRAALRDATGLSRMAESLAQHQPRAERVASAQLEGYIREEWRLWVEPEVALPFYLLLPDKINTPSPLILTPHGHNPPRIYAGIYANEEERWSGEQGERDIAVQAVRRGYIALAPTARGFGATRTPADVAAGKLSSCHSLLLNGLLVGRTPIGERVWDISRLLDWALAALPVDPARIAITGNSGGGTTTLFAAALDERLSVAVPGSYFCTFAESIGSIEHCECNYIPGMLTLGEMWDVAGLIAPRPIRVLHGLHDDIFPITATRRAFSELHRIYTAAGAPWACQLWIGTGGHRYYAAGAWPYIRVNLGH